MKASEPKLNSVESISQEISKAASECKVELLKHYLLNYILYLNLPRGEAEDSPIKEKLLKISILLDKADSMERSVKKVDANRLVDGRMMKNDPKRGGSKSKNPRKKFKINSEKLKERTKAREDYNIDAKNSKLNKFN